MKSLVRPELPTASVGPSQAPTAAVDISAPFATRTEPLKDRGRLFRQTGPLLNYRYFLHERVKWDADDYAAETVCWPPLLATERQVAGLFASALSRICPVSRSELPLLRTQSKDRIDKDPGAEDPNRRIDYYAWYGQRAVALELKRVPVSTSSALGEGVGLQNQWVSVKGQAETALTHMRKHKVDFPSAVGVAILVVRPSRAVGQSTVKGREDAVSRFEQQVKELSKAIAPQFLAVYRPPLEMQTIVGWGKDGEDYRIFPGVMFAANVIIKAPSRARKKGKRTGRDSVKSF